MSDFSDSAECAVRMQRATAKLHSLTVKVGHAKQVREYDGDRRKKLLSKHVAQFLKADESATAAEHFARSSPQYVEDFEQLAKQYEAAETTIAEWTAENASFEAARSLLSFNKAIRTDMPE